MIVSSPTTTIPAILIPLTLLCFSSQHLSPPANILFTGWLSASSTEKSTPWGQGLSPLIYPSCLHECHARSTGQVSQTHTQMDEWMSGWEEIYTHKQIKIFKSAYKYEGSQEEWWIQQVVGHFRESLMKNRMLPQTLRANVSWAEGLPTHDLVCRNWAHLNSERKKKRLFKVVKKKTSP